MKHYQLAVFLLIVLSIYGGVNAYIFIRGWQALPIASSARLIYTIAFLVCATAYIVGRIAERFWSGTLINACTWLGSFWLGAMTYFLLIVVAIDLLRVVNHFLPFFPTAMTADWARAKIGVFCGAIVAVAIILTAGFINARLPKITTLDLQIAKKVPGLSQLNIVVASDFHLGTLVGARQVNQLSTTIKRLDPDLVLFAGDIFDEDMHPERCTNICNGLTTMQPRFGTFTVPGNHEYFSGLARAEQYLNERGIRVLKDSVICIADLFYIIGRADFEQRRFNGKSRLALAELTAALDRSKPIILLDHQPVNLQEAVTNGVDLQISGHTHHGQLWPFNLLTRRVYEVSRGYKRKGLTHFYVSSGFGTWGPPIRTNSRPEIVHIRLHFE